MSTDTRRKILTADQVDELREQLRAEGKALVQCHGCFDIVHPGHLRYLEFAKAQGDVLLVSVSGDKVVSKGYDRPYIHQDLRLENLAALEIVDFVLLDHHDWAGPVLDLVRPDIYVKGKEYETKGDPRFAREKELVESYGGRVIYSSGEVVYSSTRIISEFRRKFGLDAEKVRFFCKQQGLDRASVDDLLRRMRGKRVVVLGDPILDHYVHCDASGLASEAPVVTVTPLREEWYAGGAALIAGQIASLGGRATLLIPKVEGPHRARLAEALEAAGVAMVEAGAEARQVYLKTRYLVDDTKVLKVNEGRYAPLSSRAVVAFRAELDRLLADADALVVTDFGYGMFGPELTTAVVEAASAAKVPYFADVSGGGKANILKFEGARLATPTEQELRFAYADSEAGISNLAARFYSDTRAEELILTMGKRGALYFLPPEHDNDRLRVEYLPALDALAVDTVGAGDVFLATAAMSVLAGGPMSHGVYLASAVSALHVGQVGNDPEGLEHIEQFLDGRPELER